MRYALIGCGRIAPNHIKAAENNNLEIVALCDINQSNIEKLLEFISQKDKIKIYKDYNEMLQKEKIELVAIATESGKHAMIALDCIEAGCNVIIEKPIALSIKDADEIIFKAKEKGVKVSVSHQNRFNKAVQKVFQERKKGNMGEIMYGTAHILWNRGKQYYEQAKWRGTWEQDGGTLMNQCIHNIDLLRWTISEELEEVFAYTDNLTHDYIEAEDIGLAVVKFKNGKYGMIEGTSNVYPRNLEETLYLFGTEGTVKLGGKSVNVIEEWNVKGCSENSDEIKKEFCENPPNVYGYGHTPYYKDVIESIEQDREPYITAEDGKKAIEIILAIYKSASTGKVVKFPLGDCATTDFVGRFDNGK